MMQYAHIAQRLFNRPLALHPRKAEVIVAALAERLGIVSLTSLNGATVELPQLAFDDDDDFMAPRRERRTDAGYDMLADAAIIPVQGTLVHKLGTLRPYSGMTGYDGIRQSYLTALHDPTVERIAVNIDSGGGDCSGLFELTDTIYETRGIKPVWAIVDDAAYSAAYALASACDRIILPRIGGVGSIGVICMHVDFSKAITEAGIKVTFITHGARKADFHSEIPLSDEALAAIQADVDATGALFDQTVARNRKIGADQVSGLEAACFQGQAGVDARLADAIMAPDAAFQALLAEPT